MTRTFTTGGVEVKLEDNGSERHVWLAGRIDEECSLSELSGHKGNRLVFDLEAVRFINSVGVREWIKLLRTLADKDTIVVFRRCSDVMIHQMNMIVEAKGRGEIESFMAPYACDECGYEGPQLIEVAPNIEGLRKMKAPTLTCPDCGSPIEFIEIPERYFLFLKD